MATEGKLDNVIGSVCTILVLLVGTRGPDFKDLLVKSVLLVKIFKTPLDLLVKSFKTQLVKILVAPRVSWYCSL